MQKRGRHPPNPSKMVGGTETKKAQVGVQPSVEVFPPVLHKGASLHHSASLHSDSCPLSSSFPEEAVEGTECMVRVDLGGQIMPGSYRWSQFGHTSLCPLSHPGGRRL